MPGSYMTAEEVKDNHARFLRGALVVFVFNVLQKVLAFGQQVLFARLMGLSAEADALALAQILPNLIGGLISVSAATAVVSSVTSSGHSTGEAIRRGLVASFLGLFGITGLGALVSFIFAPQIIGMLGPGGDGLTATLAIRVLRVMSPLLLILPACGILAGLQQAEHRFLWPSLSWLLPTAGSIMGMPWYPSFGVLVFAVGLLCGAVAQLILLLATAPVRWRVCPEFSRALFAAFMVRLGSIMGVAASTTLYLVTDRAMASRFSLGLPAAFALAGTLITVPSQLVSFSVNSSLLPALVPLRHEPRKFSLLWLNSSAAAAAIVMPALLLFTLAPEPLLTHLFLSRRFNAGAVSMAAVILAGYGPAMFGLLLRDCCIPGLLALGCERTVMTISGAGFVVNLVIKALAPVDSHPWVIAFASGVGLLTCGVGLLIFLCSRIRVFEGQDFSLLRAVTGASLVAATCGWALRHWSVGGPLHGALLILAIPALYIVTLMLVYPQFLYLTKFARRPF